MSEITREEAVQIAQSGTPVFVMIHFPPAKKTCEADGTIHYASTSKGRYFTDWKEAIAASKTEYAGIAVRQKKRHRVITLVMTNNASLNIEELDPNNNQRDVLWLNGYATPKTWKAYYRGDTFEELIKTI